MKIHCRRAKKSHRIRHKFTIQYKGEKKISLEVWHDWFQKSVFLCWFQKYKFTLVTKCIQKLTNPKNWNFRDFAIFFIAKISFFDFTAFRNILSLRLVYNFTISINRLTYFTEIFFEPYLVILSSYLDHISVFACEVKKISKTYFLF